MVMAKAIGSPEIDYECLEYKFIENTVMFVNKGHLVGILHRGVYNTVMKAALNEEQKEQKEDR